MFYSHHNIFRNLLRFIIILNNITYCAQPCVIIIMHLDGLLQELKRIVIRITSFENHDRLLLNQATLHIYESYTVSNRLNGHILFLRSARRHTDLYLTIELTRKSSIWRYFSPVPFNVVFPLIVAIIWAIFT